LIVVVVPKKHKTADIAKELGVEGEFEA